MRLNKLRRRRGFSLIEIIICILILAICFASFITLASKKMESQVELQSEVLQTMDIDLTAEMLQTDIKSAFLLEIVDSTELLIMTSDNQQVIYKVKDYKLYRNNEVVLNYILDGMFIPSDGNSVGVYFRLIGGDIIDATFSR